MTANYARPRFEKSNWKPEPRQLATIAKRTAKDTADKKAKAAVMLRDARTCRICGRPATEVDEVIARSLGGAPSLANSIALCAEPRGRCHQLRQQHGVRVVGAHCSKPLIFEMSAAVALAIFRRRPIPSHVRIVAR